MEGQRTPEEKTPVSIPFFVHENEMMHYNRVNQRMFFIIIAVCIAFVLTISTFVIGYTIRENYRWDTLTRMGVIQTGASDGVHE